MTTESSSTLICEKCGSQNDRSSKLCSACGTPLYKNYYKGIWFRSMTVTLVVFLLPFLILIYLLNFEVSTNFRKQINNSLDYSVQTNTRIIKTFLDERKMDLLSIAKFDGYNMKEAIARKGFFTRFIKEKPWFDLIAIADRNGNLVMTTNDITGNIKNREYFKESLKGLFYNSGIFYSDILNSNTMVISSPFYNTSNEIIGVILAAISLSYFHNLILDLRIGKTSEIFLVNEEGKFLSPSKLGGNVLTDVGYHKDDKNPHTGSGGLLIHRDYRGEKVICAYKKLSDLGWYLVSEIDTKEALAPITTLKSIMFSIFVIFGIVLISSSVIFSRQITAMLKNLTASLKSALDDISQKKNTIDTINVELRKRLKDCEIMSKQIRISEEYLKNITNSISSGLVAIDNNFKITFCNNFARELFGIKDISPTMALFEVNPVFRENDVKPKIEEIFAKNTPFFINKKNTVLNDMQVTLSIGGFPVPGLESNSSGTLLISDITEQVNMHAQMADYEKLSALSQLALGAAHEINNPLLGITSFIELLIEEEIDVEKKARSKEVLESAYRISETVRGLLNFARPTPPKFTKININRLISDTISFLKHQPLFKKLKIEKNLLDSLPQITADMNQVRQVVINVLINAAQAIVNSGTITIATNKVKFEELIEIIIDDTGIGISEENLKKVFDPFFTTKKGEGTGLGLSISLNYVKNHKGDISITGEPGKGSTVTIKLPIRQEGRMYGEVIE